jgi:predicted ester cyclase
MSDAKKKAARRMLEEAFNKGRLEVVDELVSPNVVDHDPALPGGQVTGGDAVKELVAGYRAAFPDIHMTVEDQVAAGDEVTTRWKAIGTNDGDFWGMEPTGRQATVTGITIDRFDGEKIVESWTNWDTFGLMVQLGAIPAPTTTATTT